MAYMLYKYLRRKYAEHHQVEKQQLPTTTNEHHLVPEPTPAVSGPQGHNSIDDGASLARTQTGLTKEENARIERERRRATIYRWKVILGLILPNFLAAVDTTIVAPAVPMISSHFNHLSGSFNWIVAAYTLTYTTFVPSSGMIADVYGRHTALQFHMFWILIGSVLCCAAASWSMLLLGRALQGAGAAGISNLTHIILSDNISLADNSYNNTIFSLINGISYAIGPVIGGYLAHASWRYCFVVPIPISVLSMALIFFLLRPELVKGRVSAKPGDSRRTGYIAGLFVFDWPGIFLFIFGVGLVILAIQWGGTEYAWSSPQVLACLIVGAFLWILFYLHEYLLSPGRIMNRLFPKQSPMCPSYLYRKKDTILLMIINFASGSSLVSAFYFISIYWQLAEGYSSSKAGVQLLYYTPGLGVGVYSAMYLCNIWPRQTFYALMAGSVIEATGIAVLSWACETRQASLVNGMLALSGAGTGLRFMPVVLHAAGIWPTRIPSVQSLMSFALPLGETIGITMMGAVFSNKFDQGLRGVLPSMQQHVDSRAPTSLDAFDSLPAEAREAVQNAAAHAVMWSFVSILPFMGLSILASALLGNVWIGQDAKKGKDGKAATKETPGKVLYGNFLKALITGTVDTQTVVVEKTGGDVDNADVGGIVGGGAGGPKREKQLDPETGGRKGGEGQQEQVHQGATS
ncbi:MFS general substrate transporter [Aaosphaeria arxii CBS 175.79]|uniref:MFS general substrate transporter n=1 Tax=Aaosphaeria arxii CBS 175.79 TaxID=1450172 RepID=A0A6A5Y0K7_9PLEO|nr:MFS general substrate transporter [Aaosphaeria arxii CBS 175.79]KAF2018617.1 MFS general substrate transporter [Aaosphaeria arxii CBS 175.79]